ncbi:MAG: TetR/AcrR family transcriptional regulator [Lachnospiraceae bacterium]|nr:TetR/AcrR family transcriptional regulator [Lachnospiraceae bacterium]
MEETGAFVTRRDFKDALLRLYQTIPLKDITVRMLCQTAGYNRSTFYLHYRDIIDLLHDIDTDLLESLWENVVKVLDAGTFGGEIPQNVKDFFTVNSDRFAIMLQADDNFQEKLVSVMREQFAKHAHSQMDIYRAEYTIAAVSGLFMTWFERGRDLPVEDLLALISEIDVHYLSSCDWACGSFLSHRQGSIV